MRSAFKAKQIMFIIGLAAAGAVLLSQSRVEAETAHEQCRLFVDRDQDPSSTPRSVSRLKSVFETCEQAGLKRIATREMRVGKEPYLLLVDPDSLHTEIAKKSCWVCTAAKLEKLDDTRFGAALDRLNKAQTVPKSDVLVNAGLRHAESDVKGSFATADLCPSLAEKSLNRAWFESLAKAQDKVPIALSVSGLWIKRHREDFDWLKTGVEESRWKITWVNHTYRHPFDPEKPIEETFMLTPGADLKTEVIRTEQALIEAGGTPSVFFRFPGLISNVALMKGLKALSLLPLGSDAWLAKGERPKNASIIMVHANGNEPGGPLIYEKLQKTKKIPLPLLPLDQAVDTVNH